ncbi:helix-turn-helix transcriptional regulator [Haliangium ochraceum]|uniref:Transcriptional regulator, XRE family n=1 Tax=Haliangium ochraceum (strain DSM 14365 / JCM 11303 / SMP-2) TaxID=502025 RepID=D0LRS8_HALO1|nr:helix-turn-helix transcriptional regulator [Haliangium ochraceum]ACY19070.1 transcriptional regulator, XRE family [Haliangium ochraceum DSM 14365]
MAHDPDEALRRSFARNVRKARVRRQLTQEDVAEALDVSPTVYRRYERAQIWPVLERFTRLCEVLSCSADELFGFRELDTRRRPRARDDDSPALRRLNRQLRTASPAACRLACEVLDLLRPLHRHER